MSVEAEIKPYAPIAGVDLETSEDQIPDGLLAASNNCLYERGMCINRPKLVTDQITGAVGSGQWQESFSVPGAVYTLGIDNSNVLYRMDPTTYLCTVITGPAFTRHYPVSAAVVNGVVLITTASGIIRWVPGAGVYTLITSVKPKFITAHLSRAVGAYTDVANGAINVVWSVAGDETTWTGSTNGSGSVFLSDADDEIIGLQTVNNTLVVCRRSGFHLGFATGVSIPAYRFELWSRDDVGVLINPSVARYANTLYFIGTDNVYSFDTAKLTPLGDSIKTEIITNSQLLTGNQYYNGFVTRRLLSGRSRALYHLVPSNPFDGSDLAAYPHYVLDIATGVWSKQSYEKCYFGYRLRRTIRSESVGIIFVQTPGNIQQGIWDDSLACERVASFTLPNFVLGDQFADVIVSRVLVRMRDYGFAGVPTITISTTLNTVITSWTCQPTVTGAANDSKWKRWWADARTAASRAGNDCVVSISFPANTKFAIDWLAVLWSREGDFRG